ncbi:CDGSH iron-sulfur domain-containing protein [Streptomyces sp. NPDC017254]|uniref:CDGSH iron-sulfur domain-containing protein n=1 Tax=unclassified Streptomyces TaxID=2593676 RepID=UPI00378F6B06
MEGLVEVVLDDGTVARSDRFSVAVAVCTCRRSRTHPWCDTSRRRERAGRPRLVQRRGELSRAVTSALRSGSCPAATVGRGPPARPLPHVRTPLPAIRGSGRSPRGGSAPDGPRTGRPGEGIHAGRRGRAPCPPAPHPIRWEGRRVHSHPARPGTHDRRCLDVPRRSVRQALVGSPLLGGIDVAAAKVAWARPSPGEVAVVARGRWFPYGSRSRR